MTAAKLLEPKIPAPVITETRQFDSKLAELRASVDLTKHVKAALAGTIAQAGPEAEYNQELGIEAVGEGTFTLAITEMTPTRNAVYGVYSIEDESRLSGMSDSMVRP